MPNHRKKPPQEASGLSWFVSGLRHEGGGSSLVVQTGFPTSLADLVVKNRDRLKKPSRRRKRPSDPGSSTGDVAAASPTSDFGPSHSPPREDRRFRRLHPALPESSAPRVADCARRPAPAAAGPTKRIGFGFWLGLFLVSLLVLAVPATSRRKLAGGISLAALGLWLLDAIGVRVFGFLQPGDNATRSLELVPGRMRLEGRALVSQIREIGRERLISPVREVGHEDGIVSCSLVASERSKSSSDLMEASARSMISSNLTGTSSESSKSCPDLLMRSNQGVKDSLDLNQKTKVSLKRRDLGALAKVCASPVVVGSSSNSKAKKLFGKFLKKKFPRKTTGHAANAIALDLSCTEISNSILEHEEEAMQDEKITENTNGNVISLIASDSVSTCDVENVDFISSIASDSVSTCDVKNMDVVKQRVLGAKYISSQHLACFAFILLGLLGGKTLSLVLFVFCFLFAKATESLWKKKMYSVFFDKLYNT